MKFHIDTLRKHPFGMALVFTAMKYPMGIVYLLAGIILHAQDMTFVSVLGGLMIGWTVAALARHTALMRQALDHVVARHPEVEGD